MEEHKRRKYDEIVEKVTEKGWKVISTEFATAHGNMKFLCPKGHERSIQVANFLKHFACAICSRTVVDKYEEYAKIVAVASEKGWNVLSKEYTGSHANMLFSCKNNHIHNVPFSVIQKKAGCAKCKNEEHNRKLFSAVVEEVEKRRWKLLSTGPVWVSKKMKFACENGHFREIETRRFLAGIGCAECSGIRPNKEKQLEKLRNFAESKGWKVLDTKYENATSKLHFE